MMRITLIIVAVVLVLYVASFHLLVACVGGTRTCIDGPPDRLALRCERTVIPGGTSSPSGVQTVLTCAYLPLAWVEQTLSSRALAPSDPGAQEAFDVLAVEVYRLWPVAAATPVARIRARRATVTTAATAAAAMAAGMTGISVVPDGHAWVVWVQDGHGTRVYRHTGTVVDWQPVGMP